MSSSYRALCDGRDLSAITEVISEELFRDVSCKKAGQAIVEALAENDADKLCIALTGWSGKDLLVRAGLLPDESGAIQDAEKSSKKPKKPKKAKKACAVTMCRVRREGFNTETYLTCVYLVVPAEVTVTEALLRKTFLDVSTEFMNSVEGQQAWEHTCHDFNWGDWESEIPARIMNKHGIYIDCPSRVKVTESCAFTVDQDEVIGFGVWDMAEAAQKAYLETFGATLRTLGVDSLSNSPEAFGAKRSDLERMRSEEFLTYLCQNILDNGPDATVLNNQKKCAEAVWKAYREFTLHTTNGTKKED